MAHGVVSLGLSACSVSLLASGFKSAIRDARRFATAVAVNGWGALASLALAVIEGPVTDLLFGMKPFLHSGWLADVGLLLTVIGLAMLLCSAIDLHVRRVEEPTSSLLMATPV
jgi:hypothetical protein